jgi:hypothetical protein
VHAVSITLVVKRALGFAPKLGLRYERPSSRDVVWLAGEEPGRTDMRRVKSAIAGAPAHVGASVEMHCPPIYNQIGSSCVGEMGLGLIATVDSIHGLPLDPPSSLAGYLQSVMTHTEPGMAPADEGTTIRRYLSEAGVKGVATQASWPRTRANLMRPVPSHIRAGGYNRRGLRYEFIRPFSIEEEMEMTDAAIALKQPIGFGWAVTERFMAHNSAAPYDARLRKSDRIVGGHAEMQVTARDTLGVVRYRNSWSSNRCDGGYENVIAETVTRRDIVLVSGWERIANA